MTTLFHKLPEEKKQKILAVCLTEFARQGYINASTNRIVRELGIAKGSLFQYFGTKEDLYFDIMDIALEKVYGELVNQITDMPGGFLERIEKILDLSLDILQKYPDHVRLFFSFMNIELKAAREKLAVKYAALAFRVFSPIFQGIDRSTLRVPLEDAVMAVKWIISGIRTQWTYAPDTEDIGQLRQFLARELKNALSAMRWGIER